VSRLPGQIRSKSVESVSAAVAATTTAVLHAPGGLSSANADASASSSSIDAPSTAAADSNVPAVIGAELASASASSSSSSDLDSTATAAHTSPPQLLAPGASSTAAAAAAAAPAGVAAAASDDENHVEVAVAELHVPAVVGAASSAAAKPLAPAASSSLHAPVGGGVLVSASDATSDAADVALGGSMSKLRSLHVWESADDTDSWQMPSTLAGQLEAAQRCDLMQTVLAFEQLEVDIAFRADKARSLTLVEYRLVRERLAHLVREYQRRADELRYCAATGRIIA
jgi:hypothetical protein